MEYNTDVIRFSSFAFPFSTRCGTSYISRQILFVRNSTVLQLLDSSYPIHNMLQKHQIVVTVPFENWKLQNYSNRLWHIIITSMPPAFRHWKMVFEISVRLLYKNLSTLLVTLPQWHHSIRAFEPVLREGPWLFDFPLMQTAYVPCIKNKKYHQMDYYLLLLSPFKTEISILLNLEMRQRSAARIVLELTSYSSRGVSWSCRLPLALDTAVCY